MKYLCLSLWLAFPLLTFSQQASVKGSIDVQKSNEGYAIFSGLVVNNSTLAQALSYSLQVNKYSPSGNSINTQSGSFTLLPDESKSLSQVSINLTSTASFEIILKIFDDQQVLVEEILNSDDKFFSYFSTLKVPEVKKTTPDIPIASNPKMNSKINSTTDALEIDGLVIDETRSKSGRDFYDFFYKKWDAPRGAKDFTITIKELPARGRGARIAVEVNGSLLYQRFLQPRQDIIELMAEQTINVVKKHLSDSEQLKQDLESDDQKGSGIF